jgi:hypothetical protein
MSKHNKNSAGLNEIEIQGMTFEIEKWNAEDALDTLLDIAKVVGKPLGVAIGSFRSNDEELEADLNEDGEEIKKPKKDSVGMIFEALTDRLDKKLVKSLVIKMSSDKILCDGKPVVYKTFYQDRLDLCFLVVKANLEVQYGNFFDAVLNVFQK